MLDTVTKFIRALRIPTTEELESRYLNEASSRYDLEQREREVESGRFRRRTLAVY